MLERKNETLKEEIKTLKEEIKTLKEEIKILEEEKESLESENYELRRFKNRMKNNSKLGYVRNGITGQLVSIEEKELDMSR